MKKRKFRLSKILRPSEFFAARDNNRFAVQVSPTLFSVKSHTARSCRYRAASYVKGNPKTEKTKTRETKRNNGPLPKTVVYLVEMTGFEPAASASRTQRSTKLSHISQYSVLLFFCRAGARLHRRLFRRKILYSLLKLLSSEIWIKTKVPISIEKPKLII